MRYCVFILMIFLVGCGTKYEISPSVASRQNGAQLVASATDTSDFMLKYLPSNLKNDVSDLKFTYKFIYDDDKTSNAFGPINIFNPLVLVGFPLGQDDFKMAGNLKFFDAANEIKLSSVCVVRHTRSMFNNTNFTEYRNECIGKIIENLKSQIDEIHSKGGFNVFKK